MTTTIVYQAVDPTELHPEDMHRSFVWHSLERTFGNLPATLGKRHVDQLEALGDAFFVHRLVNKQPWRDYELNPFYVLVDQIKRHGIIRVWVRHTNDA